MVPELGLVCITASKAVRYRTLTRKRLFQFDSLEQARMLRELYVPTTCGAWARLLSSATSTIFDFIDSVLRYFRLLMMWAIAS